VIGVLARRFDVRLVIRVGPVDVSVIGRRIARSGLAAHIVDAGVAVA
jgi:hypothetical protein